MLLRQLLLPLVALAVHRPTSHFLPCDAFAVVRQPSSRRSSAVRRVAVFSTAADSNASVESSETSSSPVVSDPSVVSRRVFAQDKRPVILFDGVCNMCNSAVNLALDWDPRGKLRFAALQSNVGRALLQDNGREADDISSIVLVTEGGAYIKSDAILKITEELTPKWLPVPLGPAAKAGRFLVPGFLRDLIYDGVADNRYEILGMRDECRFDADGEFEDRFVDDALGST